MTAAVRLALFGVVLALVLVAAYALGSGMEPTGFAREDERPPAPAHGGFHP